MISARVPAVIIGAGPAGLTAAYELVRNGVRCQVFEADCVAGGLARTAEYKGYLFDVGGHRFYTKVSLIEKIWREILGPDLLTRPRLSRIYYRSKFFQYPLDARNTIRGLGLLESALCTFSYAAAKIRPTGTEDDFESWIVNRFGRRLYETFFKTYTEKVWGIPCREIRAEWAAQRIRGLSFHSAVLHALGLRNRSKEKHVRTLINSFEYPRRGPGMMWTRMAERIEDAGSAIVFDSPVEKILWRRGEVTGIRAGGQLYHAGDYISSMAIRDLVHALDPVPPPAVLNAADDFSYRDFITVALIVDKAEVFPDNWIYIHEPSVHVGRIQNYKNWSPEMVPDDAKTCLGLEYFCSEGDALWARTDAELIELAARELDALGLVNGGTVVDGTVLRMRKAYPVYDDRYTRGLAVIREFLEHLPNLQLVGRNGMHRYNNQDHSMLTGLLAARNILGASCDLWDVHVDSDYLEGGNLLSEAELAELENSQPRPPKRLYQTG